MDGNIRVLQERKEDMSPDGKLMLIVQADGDVIVSVTSSDEGTGAHASIEFCTPFSGGGGSPRTHKALLALVEAMQADNQDAACQQRSGRDEADQYWQPRVELRVHEPHCPVPRAAARGEGAVCLCVSKEAQT